MPIHTHPDDEKLEQYCVGSTLTDEQIAAIEEHVLVCATCQDRVRQHDDYINAMRTAVAALPPRDRERRKANRPWVLKPAPIAAIAGCAALGLVLIAGPAIRQSRGTAPVAVMLQATRGTDVSLRSRAPARTPLRLELDVAGVPELPSYRLEIVDRSGRPVLQGSAAADKGKVTLATPDRLAAGSYWVRIYDPAAPEHMLREYGLELGPK